MAIQHTKTDPTWSMRKLMTPKEFGNLLQMIVDTTYFRFNGQIYKQIYIMAMVSPLSPVLINLFMEEAIQIKLQGATLNRTGGYGLSDPYLSLMRMETRRAVGD